VLDSAVPGHRLADSLPDHAACRRKTAGMGIFNEHTWLFASIETDAYGVCQISSLRCNTRRHRKKEP
jgi:hypothetical protein